MENRGSINKISYNETYDIICHMNSKISKKIPKSFLDFIKDNREKNYKVNVDYSNKINKASLQRDTRILLSLIYRDYLCTPEERKILEEKDKYELQKIEQEKRKRYDPNNLFKNKQIDNINNKKEQQQLIEYKKENMLQRIFRKIRIFFNKFYK